MRARQNRISLLGLLQAAAWLTVVFSAATAFETKLHFIELFTHFRLQYLVVAIVLVIAFFVARDGRYVVAMIATAALNAWFVYPLYIDLNQKTGATPLKLIHANVLASNTDYDKLLELVRVEEPDLVFLQEVTPEWRDGIAPIKSSYPYSYVEPRYDNFGIALYSRIPFESVGHVDSPPLGHPTIFSTISVDGKQVTVVSSHPTIPLGKPNYEARNQQLEDIAKLTRIASGEMILTGDFNASVWDPKFRTLEAQTGLKNVRRGFGVLPTWPTFMPFAMIPIDHMLVSSGLTVDEARTGSSIGSDHLPLIVTLSL